MYTRSTPVAEAIANRQWFVVDLEGQTLGRAATRIAHILRGKHKPSFTPHIDDGDYIIVINAEKVRLTGNKLKDKKYYRHTGFVGGIREISAEKLLARHPDDLIRKAVKGMLPRGPLGRAQLRKLKIFVGPQHNHESQKPEVLDLNTVLS
ncbi:50S ribosomal protein L13 [Myxococcota bacterium]|nr:50S ribosomal protein L13 [Myxococcota bacterium]MBU1431276.1 50S ribosomal protein L13 [Myxococcota bacterium]MBU1900460.1 50S ribosomal protein L13 [Myxococcota bacterium]